MQQSTNGLSRFLWSALIVLIVAFANGRLEAQSTTATILGTVTDPSGATIPDATISATNTETNVARTTVSDSQGRFRIPELGLGTYDIRASKVGFSAVVRQGITLTLGSEVVVPFSLQVGEQQQTITVQAEVSQVETQSTAVGTLVEPTQMRELPLNGRNFGQLILLAPGVQAVTASTQAFYGKGDNYSIAGSRPEGTAFLLDNTDISDFWNHGTGAGALGTQLGLDAIAEFQTLVNTYGAQFGGNGAVVSAVTRSGTNAFHGSA
ncbi:MAG: carboxypeptidase-like regulatory domain-containing protein, partial [Acidobacteriota bacterium]|nr:carboxypeptidase-like regulatory domain-containing protein [Acidobacteriota bacterium]